MTERIRRADRSTIVIGDHIGFAEIERFLGIDMYRRTDDCGRKLIVVTLAHVDHAGSAATIRELSGAPILAAFGVGKFDMGHGGPLDAAEVERHARKLRSLPG